MGRTEREPCAKHAPLERGIVGPREERLPLEVVVLGDGPHRREQRVGIVRQLLVLDREPPHGRRGIARARHDGRNQHFLHVTPSVMRGAAADGAPAGAGAERCVVR